MIEIKIAAFGVFGGLQPLFGLLLNFPIWADFNLSGIQQTPLTLSPSLSISLFLSLPLDLSHFPSNSLVLSITLSTPPSQFLIPFFSKVSMRPYIEQFKYHYVDWIFSFRVNPKVLSSPQTTDRLKKYDWPFFYSVILSAIKTNS